MLPPPVGEDWTEAANKIAIHMLFPEEEERRIYAENAIMAAKYKALLEAINPISGIHLSRDAWDRPGDRAVVNDLLKGFAEEFSRRGMRPPTFVAHTTDSAVMFEPSVSSWIVSELDKYSRQGSPAELLSSAYARVCKDGLIAGITLLNVLGLKELVGEKASLSLGREALSIAMGPRGGSRSNLNDAWSRFGSVAHFWAAYVMWMNSPEAADSPAAFPCPADKLPAFLWLSEEFRKSGEGYTPDRAHAPILDSAASWKLHPSLVIDPPSGAGFKFGEVPESMMAVLQRRGLTSPVSELD